MQIPNTDKLFPPNIYGKISPNTFFGNNIENFHQCLPL